MCLLVQKFRVTWHEVVKNNFEKTRIYDCKNYHSEESNPFLRIRSVQQREHIFVENDNRKNFCWYHELYNHAIWGVHGGAEGFWWLRKLKNIHHFHEKPTFLKLHGWRSRGAHGGAQKWRGEWVGEFSHTWWGDGGALQTPVSQFVAKKMGFLNLGIWSKFNQ